MPASSVRDFARSWTGSLADYRNHANDEHLEALIEEAARYAGLHLENDLSRSQYWSKASLGRRIAVLLFLVDRGVVNRRTVKGRRFYEPTPDAESWVISQPSLTPYVQPSLELIGALRNVQSRRNQNRSA